HHPEAATGRRSAGLLGQYGAQWHPDAAAGAAIAAGQPRVHLLPGRRHDAGPHDADRRAVTAAAGAAAPLMRWHGAIQTGMDRMDRMKGDQMKCRMTQRPTRAAALLAAVAMIVLVGTGARAETRDLIRSAR